MLFSCLDYREKCCNEQEGADMSCRYWFHSLGHTHRIGIAGSYSSSLWNFWGNSIPFLILNTFRLPPTGYWSPFSLHSYQHLFSLIFGNSHPNRDEVVSHCGFLICTSVMSHNIEHLFMFLLAICPSSLEKYIFRSLAYF